MKAGKLSRVHVRDARTAAIFTDPRLRRILLWFTRSPKSIGETAALLGMDLKRTHYYVRKLVRLGLLFVAEERARAGRPILHYRAAGDSFFVPSEVAPKGFGEELARELRESLAIEAARSEGGILFTAAKGGSPRGRVVGQRGAAGAVEMWRVLRLAPKQAAALKRDMTALLNRHQKIAAERGGTAYLVHAAVAPRLVASGLADNEDPALAGAAGEPGIPPSLSVP
ncbi:MAG: hypothetical protein JO276_02795 [Sphingomonadaceae bacterium]|nr:hypothetical protein [Sphingomonadaceae bacterium]